MIYVFKFIQRIVLFLSESIYWVFLGLVLVLYCIGYTLWFFKIPKNVLEDYNKMFEDFFKDEIKKVEREGVKKPATFERGRDPKIAMDIGNDLVRRKQKLFKKIRRYLSILALAAFGIVLLFVFFLKAMIIITVGLAITIAIVIYVLD